jgi:TolA-binding protein
MRPQMEESVPAEDDKRPVDRELAELRKEVVEARNLVIKTDNLLKNLHAEVKNLSKRGDEQYRRTRYSSATAYAGFLGLAVVLGVLASRASVASERARVESSAAEAELSRKRADELTAQAQKHKQEVDQAKTATERALAAYRLMSEGEGEGRLKGVDELAKLDRSRLTALEQRVLEDRARALKVELGQTAFERGRTAVRREDMRTGAAELRRYLALDPDGPDAVQANYLLGAALYTLRDFEGAVAALERFAAKAKGQRNADYALYLLGAAHGTLGHHERAAEIFKRALAEYPASEYAPQMQLGYRNANRGAHPAQAVSSPAPGAPQGGAAQAGAAPTAKPAAAPPRPAASAPQQAPTASTGEPKRP